MIYTSISTLILASPPTTANPAFELLYTRFPCVLIVEREVYSNAFGYFIIHTVSLAKLHKQLKICDGISVILHHLHHLNLAILYALIMSAMLTRD